MSADLITVADARARVIAAVRSLPEERVEISAALDRVLAQDIVAAGDVPPFPCAAMDGYALAAGPSGRTLKVVGQSRAGAPSDRSPSDGEAIRISTGAAVPVGASAVIRQEDTATPSGAERGQAIHTRAAVAPGENIRWTGEDLRAGDAVVAAGTKLRVAELGAAVAAGAGVLTVVRRPRVAVVCTGDELRGPGEPLGPGEIHNSNAPMLVALALRSGALVGPAERLRDDRRTIEEAIASALERADVVVVSGGVSVGPHDHVKPALAALGVAELFWGVALAPGKPTWFGTRDEKLVFGLPGNPVSCVVTFALFVTPALAAQQGQQPNEGEADRYAELGAAVRRNPRREQALRVRLEDRNGRRTALLNGAQGSHLVSSLLGADALALIPPGAGTVAAGTRVALIPLPR